MIFALRNIVCTVLILAVCVLFSCSECTEPATENPSSGGGTDVSDQLESSSDQLESSSDQLESSAEPADTAAEPEPGGESGSDTGDGGGREKTLEPNKDAQAAFAKALAGAKTGTPGSNPFAAPQNDGQKERSMEFVVDDEKAIATPSGLHYTVLAEGKGPKPDKYAKVKVHYIGTLMDGTEFHSTYKREQPFGFKLHQARPEGLKEGLHLMSAGAKYKLYVPPKLGFGERGVGSTVPPNAGLIYEVELVEFEPGPKMPEFTQGNPEAQKKTPEGLIYEVLKEGTGPGVEDGFLVDLEFTFWGTDGELLDSSLIRGSPWKFNVGKANEKIFNLGTLLLKEGGRNRYVVPPELAFGKRGRGALVPPNATLIFEMELKKVYVPLPVPKFSLSTESKLTVTKSGLAYEVIREGEGEPPKTGSIVSVHYAGWLDDGTLFDNSFKKGIPRTFPLSRVIVGWTEGLQLMKPGAIYKFTIPPDLGYGEFGQPPRIPGGATLIFHIELIEVKK